MGKFVSATEFETFAGKIVLAPQHFVLLLAIFSLLRYALADIVDQEIN